MPYRMALIRKMVLFLRRLSATWAVPFVLLIFFLGLSIIQNHRMNVTINRMIVQLAETQTDGSVREIRVKTRLSSPITEKAKDLVEVYTQSQHEGETSTAIYVNDQFSSTSSYKEFRPISANTLAALKTKLYLMSWPSLTGYDNRWVIPDRNGPDFKLYERILQHQNEYTQPLFQLRKNGMIADRHPWKFEKIIHQTWIDEQIPGQTVPWVKKWLELHPDWTYMFWTDKAAHEFITEHFPALLTPFESWTIPVQKADMFRYVVLYAFGGVYADLDMEVLKNLEDVRNWSSCVLSREPDLQTFIMSNFMNCWGNNWTFTCNAFMACRSHHPFMHYLISRVVHWSPYILKRPCALSATIACTGPWMMSFSYTFYRRSVSEELRAARKELEVICPEYEWFLPTFDETRNALVKKNCANEKNDDRQKRICKIYEERGFKNEPLNYSYTTHHWFHSYHVNVNKEQADIRRQTKVLQWTKATEDTDFYITYPGS